jgi:hypothetical protein
MVLDTSEASWQMKHLTLWYFAAGVVVSIVSRARDPVRKALHWGNWLVAVVLIAYYTFCIYGEMQQRFGGGAPLSAVLYLDKQPQWADSTIINVKVLDQTGEGYYIILSSLGDREALFIRRSEVSAVYFGERKVFPTRKP